MNKKVIYTLMAAAVFAAAFTGCNSAVVEESTPGGIAPEASQAPDSIKAYVVETYPGVKDYMNAEVIAKGAKFTRKALEEIGRLKTILSSMY